jgi:hypothetical protein
VKKPPDINALRCISGIFTPASIGRLVYENDDKAIMKALLKCPYPVSQKRIRHIIDEFYELLKMNYSIEYVIKNTIFNDLVIMNRLEETVLLDEFRIENSIADLVILNGETQVCEIKTSFDDLTKLHKQIQDYRKFAEKVWVFSTPVHECSLRRMFKDTSIGVKIIDEQGIFTEIKSAEYNNQFFSHEALFKVLHKSEYINIVRDCFGFQPEVPNTMIYRECFNLVRKIDVSEFQQMVISKLKARSVVKQDLIATDAVPVSLKYLCYLLQINEGQLERLK